MTQPCAVVKAISGRGGRGAHVAGIVRITAVTGSRQTAVRGLRPAHCARRILRRMPRLQVYLPDDLYNELKRRGLPASELLQEAVRAELERHVALEAMDEYVAELSDEVGQSAPDEASRADEIARRVRNRILHQAG